MKKHKGILTLEAALMIPIFVFAILFICEFMKLSLIYDTVQTNIYSTAKFVNGYTYAERAISELNVVQKAGETTEKADELIAEVMEVYNDLFNKDAEFSISDFIKESIKKGENKAFVAIVEKSLEDELKSSFGSNYTKKLSLSSDFDCSSSEITFGEDGQVKIIVEYSVKLGMPIFNINKDIKFRNQVVIKNFS